MPLKLPSFPERPRYNSVEAYLSELAKDIAEMVADSRKMGRFREQLKVYADFWKQWTTSDEADRKGCWTPVMGRPECIFNIFSRSYNLLLKEFEKDTKRLAGSYALCALLHDKQLPHLDKINTNIIPVEAIAETLSAPKNTLEASILDSSPNIREIYLIEEFFNRVKVDLKEFCDLKENKSKQKFVEKQIRQSRKLSDIKFFELTAEKFEERAKKILAKDETWHDLDRSLKGWFEAAIKRLERLHFKDKIGLLKYFYKNILHYAEGINIKSFRGFPDSRIAELASQAASELAEEFKKLPRSDKENIVPQKLENESDAIVELLKKDYLLENEDNLKQKIAEIVQDFISRGLFNSTVCVGQQLQACFDHNKKLIDHIIKTWQQNFADIPPDNIKEKLFSLVDEEYKKLIPFANSRLVTAGLAQSNTLKGVEQQINSKKEKAKQAIETKCAIIENQRLAQNNHSSPYIKAGGDIVAGGDIIVGNENISPRIVEKSKKENKPLYKKLWPYITGAVIFLAAIATILILLFGDNVCNRSHEKPEIDKPVVQQVTPQNALGNYKIEFPKLEAKNRLNDNKDSGIDVVKLQLFAGAIDKIGENLKPINGDKLYIFKKGVSCVKGESYEFGENFKETFITIRLCVVGKGEEIQIGNVYTIPLKETAEVIYKFEEDYNDSKWIPKWIPKWLVTTRTIKYSLTYKISQKDKSGPEVRSIVPL